MGHLKKIAPYRGLRASSFGLPWLAAKEALAISNEDKGLALIGAASNGHALCVQYLIETCKEITDKDKQKALKVGEKHDAVAQYLRSHLNPHTSHANPLVFNIAASLNQNAHKRKQEGNDDGDENNHKRIKTSENQASNGLFSPK